MIQLAKECLLFENFSGEKFPCNAESISVEILGKAANTMDEEFVQHAAAAVLHYFRDELGKSTVTVAEFSEALEKILKGFNNNKLTKVTSEELTEAEHSASEKTLRVVNADLVTLADQSADAGELLFFPRLRDELREQLKMNPELLCFLGLRTCVKRLAGAHRWNSRCQELETQIVNYLRECLTQDNAASKCALMVR